jgi:hypothetical protein
MTEVTLINNQIELLHPGNTANNSFPTHTFAQSPFQSMIGHLYWRLMIELGGFCPLTLSTRGLLVPGSWNHGIVRYREKLYALASPDAVKTFAADPDAILDDLTSRVARSNPDMVQLLHLYQSMPVIDTMETVRNLYTRLMV